MMTDWFKDTHRVIMAMNDEAMEKKSWELLGKAQGAEAELRRLFSEHTRHDRPEYPTLRARANARAKEAEKDGD